MSNIVTATAEFFNISAEPKFLLELSSSAHLRPTNWRKIKVPLGQWQLTNSDNKQNNRTWWMETIIKSSVSHLIVCSALCTCTIFVHNRTVSPMQYKINAKSTPSSPTPLQPYNLHLPLFLMCTHSSNQCQASSLSLKPCMGQNGELAQPLSKGASNPASSTQLPSVSGIRETLSPVIYHNDETQLWAMDSCLETAEETGSSKGHSL